MAREKTFERIQLEELKVGYQLEFERHERTRIRTLIRAIELESLKNFAISANEDIVTVTRLPDTPLPDYGKSRALGKSLARPAN